MALFLRPPSPCPTSPSTPPPSSALPLPTNSMTHCRSRRLGGGLPSGLPSLSPTTETGVSFPAFLEDGRRLLGTGVRRKSIMGLKNIDVYAFGIYFLIRKKNQFVQCSSVWDIWFNFNKFDFFALDSLWNLCSFMWSTFFFFFFCCRFSSTMVDPYLKCSNWFDHVQY